MDCYNIDFDILFETSWEVCNKVGGIYTVLSTKAKTLQNCYKDKTIFIGPDVWTEENPSPFFTESKTVLKKWREQATLPPGVTVRTGRWNIPASQSPSSLNSTRCTPTKTTSTHACGSSTASTHSTHMATTTKPVRSQPPPPT